MSTYCADRPPPGNSFALALQKTVRSDRIYAVRACLDRMNAVTTSAAPRTFLQSVSHCTLSRQHDPSAAEDVVARIAVVREVGAAHDRLGVDQRETLGDVEDLAGTVAAG